MKAKTLIAALSLALLAGCSDDSGRINATSDETLTQSVFENMEARHRDKLDAAFKVFTEHYPSEEDFRAEVDGMTLDELIAEAERLSGRAN